MQSRNRPFVRLSRRAGVAAAGLTAVAIALTGCSGGSTSAQTDSTAPVTLTVQIQAGQAPMVDVLEKNFKKTHPNVSFKQIVITDNQKNGTNAQVVSGSNPPDLAIVPPNSPTAKPLIQNKQVVPLSDVWKNQNLEKRYGTAAATTMKWLNGVPYVVVVDRVYYDDVFVNKDLFKKAGVPVPTDHRFTSNAQLYSAVDKLRAAGIQPMALGGNEVYLYAYMLDGLLASAATTAQYNNFLTSFNPKVPVTVKFTDPPFVDSVQQIKNWADHKVFRDGYLGQSDANAQADFTAGKVAMYLTLSANAPTISKSGINAEWALLPPVPGKQKVRQLSYEGNAYAIPTHSKHIAVAKEFLEYWMTDQMQAQAVANTSVGLPAVNTVPISSLKGLDPYLVTMIADASKNGAPAGFDATAPGEYAIDPIDANIQKMLTGQLTVHQVAELQQAGLEKIRASGGK